MHTADSAHANGFSLIEFLIVLALVMILVSVAVPAVGTIRDDDLASQLLELTERLSRAATSHYRDTGQMAVEFSPANGGHSYTQSRYHQLSAKQKTDNWKGPYLERALSLEDNPFGSAVYLQNHLSASPANGFDLAGSGSPDATGRGQFVVIYGVPERIAKIVDDKLDAESNDDGDTWKQSGRVEWSSSGGGACMIYIMSKS